ncbi:MAG: thermonuclease family protein [Fuerstiella sp.]
MKSILAKLTSTRLSTIAALVFAGLILLRATGITSVANKEQLGRTVVVGRILDGDTFDTSDGERIRLLGIDAPEVAHHGSKAQPFGNESRDWLRARLSNQSVKLTFEHRQQDHYGRTLAWVWLNNKLINQASLQTGHSKLLAKYGLPLDLEEGLRNAAAEARVQQLGLWKRK